MSSKLIGYIEGAAVESHLKAIIHNQEMDALQNEYEEKLAYYRSINEDLVAKNETLRRENETIKSKYSEKDILLASKGIDLNSANRKIQALEAELLAHEAFSERMGLELGAMNESIVRALNRYVKDDCDEFVRSIELRFHQSMPWSLSNEVREFFVKNTKKLYLEKITDFYKSINEVADPKSRELKRKVFVSTLSKEATDFINSNIMDIIGGHIENAQKMIDRKGTVPQLENGEFKGLIPAQEGAPVSDAPQPEAYERMDSDKNIRQNKNAIGDRLKKSAGDLGW